MLVCEVCIEVNVFAVCVCAAVCLVGLGCVLYAGLREASEKFFAFCVSSVVLESWSLLIGYC